MKQPTTTKIYFDAWASKGALGIYGQESLSLYNQYQQSRFALETYFKKRAELARTSKNEYEIKFLNSISTHSNNAEQLIDHLRTRIENAEKGISFRVTLADLAYKELLRLFFDLCDEAEKGGINTETYWERFINSPQNNSYTII